MAMRGWQIKLHARALPGHAVHADGPAALPGEAVNLAKAQPSTFAKRLGGEKRLEDARQYVRRDTLTAVLNLEADKAAVQALHFPRQAHHPNRQANAPRPCDGVPCIEQQVEQHHLQLPGIHLNERQVGLYLHLKPNGIRQRMLQQAAGGIQQAAGVDTGHIEFAMARKAEQLAGQVGTTLPGLQDVLQHAPGALRVV